MFDMQKAVFKELNELETGNGARGSDYNNPFVNYGLTLEQLVELGVEPSCDMPEGDAGPQSEGEGEPANADPLARLQNGQSGEMIADEIAAGLL